MGLHSCGNIRVTSQGNNTRRKEVIHFIEDGHNRKRKKGTKKKDREIIHQISLEHRVVFTSRCVPLS